VLTEQQKYRRSAVRAESLFSGPSRIPDNENTWLLGPILNRFLIVHVDDLRYSGT
jgi:hypothetical protein